jgi:serine/threonine protein kinase
MRRPVRPRRGLLSRRHSQKDVVHRGRRQHPPSIQDRYSRVAKLGEGGSGTVWSARDSKTGELVAVKTMDVKVSAHTMRSIASNEVHALKKTEHTNIVAFRDLHTVGNEVWIVMEYMDGGSLADIVTRFVMNDKLVSLVVKGYPQRSVRPL